MRRIAVVFVLGLAASLVTPATGVSAAPLDGRVVYSDAYGGSGIYTISPDGTDRVHVVDESGTYRPQWLPDGSGISFLADPGAANGRTRLEAVDVDGAARRVLIGLRELPGTYEAISSYAWSPDGTRIALSLWGGRSNPALFVADADGGSMTRIGGNLWSPDWSSLDRLVAVHRSRLVTLDPDGGNLARLGAGIASDPSWSPDGTRITFMCGDLVHADICVVEGDGTGLANLTESSEVDWSPSWSPDGSRIIWALSRRVATFANLRRMRADGSATTRITSTVRIDEYEPDWIVLT